MSVSNIETERLILMPMTHKMMHTLIENNTDEVTKLGLQLHEKWPRQDTLDILWFLKDLIKSDEDISGFDIWMVIKKDGMQIIGDAGFKGKPDDDGKIEIGFGLVDDEQKKGYGLEAARGLMDWASQQQGVKTILAECLLDNVGSIKVLTRCGMTETRRDHEYIYWEKHVR